MGKFLDRAAGLGFVIPEGYFFLDIDHRPKENALVQTMLRRFDSCAEYSVSGSGIHIYGKCDPSQIPVCRDNSGKLRLDRQVVNISATSRNHINAMDMEQGYGDGENPVVLKSEFLLSLCEQLVGSGKLSAKEKSIIDRCTAGVYHDYIRNGYRGAAPTLKDFHAELLRQTEAEARDVALAIELFTEGSLNTFVKPSNVDTNSRILCYDIRDLGKQLLPVGMLVVPDKSTPRSKIQEIRQIFRRRASPLPGQRQGVTDLQPRQLQTCPAPEKAVKGTSIRQQAQAVKTKEVWLQHQAVSPAESPAQARAQGGCEFIREQGRKEAVRRTELRRSKEKDNPMVHAGNEKTALQNGTIGQSPRPPAPDVPSFSPPSQSLESPGTANTRAAGPAKRAAKKAASKGEKAVKASRAGIKNSRQAVKVADRSARAAQKTAQTAAKAPRRAVKAARATAKAGAATAREVNHDLFNGQ